MKKKSLLGILAVLMVFALALTGCGQKGEQNAGATSSEGQNETVENGEASESEVATEPESPSVNIGEKPDGSDPMELMAWYYARDKAYIESVEKDANGYYHYKVGDKELLCKTNVWDFIEVKEGQRGAYYVWHFDEMVEAIGLYPDGIGFISAAKISPDDERNAFSINAPGDAPKTPYGQALIQEVGGSYVPRDTSRIEDAVYRLSESGVAWAIRLDQICFAAYELEQIRLGRTEDEIMISDFGAWSNDNGYVSGYDLP